MLNEKLATKKTCPLCGAEAKHYPAHGIYAAQFDCPKCGTVPDKTKPERVIIGEGERAGLPVSAPIGPSPVPQLPGVLRWRKAGETFVLEQYGRSGCCSFGWHEVPCIVE